MSKIHFADYRSMIGAPIEVLEEWAENNQYGTRCGYVQKRTTHLKDEVTCIRCLNKLGGPK